MSEQSEQHTTVINYIERSEFSQAEEIMDGLNDSEITPPLAPRGYVLYKHQQLKRSAWLPENTFPTFHIIKSYRYVRLEDVADQCLFTDPYFGTRSTAHNHHHQGAKIYRCPSDESAPLDVIIHQALVRQYIYTGDYDADFIALHMYLQRYDRAIKRLEVISYNDREENAEKFYTEQTIRVARDALKDEFMVFRRDSAAVDNDAGGEAYHGFDEFDMGMPSLPKRRPKGYKWVCRC